MATKVIAMNARRIRSSKGMTQAGVAEAAGISVLAYQNIENGKSIPRADTMQAIATALGCKIQHLVAPVKTLNAVRFRALKKMTAREQILSEVTTWLENYNDLENLLNVKNKYLFIDLANSVEESQDPTKRPKKLAELARRKLNLDYDGRQEVIRDVCGLIESAGIKIYPYSFTSDSFFGLSVGVQSGGPAIVVNTNKRMPVERWIFSAIHELGHLLMHVDAYQVEEKAEDKKQEDEANLFASYFLMPDALFEKEWKDTYGLPLVRRVLKVKRIFKVSYGTVLHRLIEKGYAKNSIWAQYRYHFKLYTGRTLSAREEPQPISSFEFSEARSAEEGAHLLPEDFIPDRLYRLVRQALNDEVITLGRAAEILGMSLSKMHEYANYWILEQ